MIKLFKYNFLTLFSFEIIYNTIILFLVTPALIKLFNFTFTVNNISYLTQENIFSYLTNPFVILILVVIMFFITIFTIFEIFAINILFIYAKNKQKINIKTLILTTFSKTKVVLKSKNLLFFIYVVLLIPFLGFIYQNPILQSIEIPNFIVDSILQNNTQLFLTIFFGIFISIFIFFNTYTFLFMFSEQKHFYQSLKNSFTLVKKTFWKLVFQMLKLFIFVSILFVLLYFLQNLFLNISNSFDSEINFILGSSLFLSINIILTTTFEIIVKIASVFVIANLFFEYNKTPTFENKIHKDIKTNKYFYILISIALFSSSLINIFLIESSDFEAKTKVMAHRGSSATELENTKEAFLLAMKQKAKYIELDVVLTKDQKVAVLHDLNLKRLAGIDKNVEDLTMEELKKIEIYSHDKTKKGNILSLEELLPLINKETILNVELKPQNQNVKILAEKTENVLKNTPRHMVSSLNSKALMEIKKINPQRKTGLILTIALGGYKKLSYADFFSIEENFATQKSIDQIHSERKEVFVWTVNDVENVSKFYDKSVDGIITDYPKIIKDEIEKSKLNYKARMFEKIFNIK